MLWFCVWIMVLLLHCSVLCICLLIVADGVIDMRWLCAELCCVFVLLYDLMLRVV